MNENISITITDTVPLPRRRPTRESVGINAAAAAYMIPLAVILAVIAPPLLAVVGAVFLLVSLAGRRKVRRARIERAEENARWGGWLDINP